MAYAGMKTTGPACCCCNHLYSDVEGNNDEQVQRNDTAGNTPGKAADFYVPTHFAPYSHMDFDPVHKLVFAVRGTTGGTRGKVVRLDENLENELLLETAGGSETVRHVTSDSDGARIFYVRWTTGGAGRDLYTVNHDGTGSTLVGPITNGDAGNSRFPLHYCRADSRIYYCPGNALGLEELNRIDADGSNDTNLATSVNTNGRIFNCTIDNDNSVLWWCDVAFAVGETTKIYKSNLDGSGVTLVYTAPAVSLGGQNIRITSVQWSHKQQKLYFWRYDANKGTSSDTANGLCTINADGSGETVVIARGNGSDWWTFGTNLNVNFRLGCGYETTGTGSVA